MKQIILSLILAASATLVSYAQTADTLNTTTPDSLAVELASMDADSLAIEMMLDSLSDVACFPQQWDESTLSDVDFRMMNWAMSWLDTTNCTLTHDTTILADSIYKARLQAMPCVIELPYNAIVRGFIIRYVRRLPKQVARMSRMSEYYFPIFEDALGRHNLPYELKYLPIIESALNPSAHSPVGAAGLWQFMPYTGKRYGLTVNSLVDERMDPIKATEAACHFLNDLYAIFHDWTLVIAAYNCGPGNVSKAIHRAGGKKDFWAIYPYLPRETRSYVPIFIAANYAMNYNEEHGICAAPIEQTMLTDTIHVSQRMHLQQVSEILDISIGELRRLNAQYPRDILPGGQAYPLCLPAEKMGDFIAQQDTIVLHKADELINNRRAEIEAAQKTAPNGSYTSGGVTYYKIKNGDNLGAIAKKFHVTVKQLKQWNGLKSDNIQAGKTLKIMK